MVKLYTNRHLHPVLRWEDLTAKEKEWFDYDSAPESTFFRYKGQAYDLNQFSLMLNYDPGIPKCYTAWHGDSYFSGVVVEYPAMIDGIFDPDYCRCATYIS